MPVTPTGEVYPISAIGNFGFDFGINQWIKVLATGGATHVNIARWGGTAVTGDDLTLRFYALNDATVQGLLASIGVVTPPGTDASANQTQRKFLERIAESVDTIGAVAGLLRTLGDVGAGATAPGTGKTIAKILEDILAGVAPSTAKNRYETLTGAAANAESVDIAFAQDVDFIMVKATTADLLIRTTDWGAVLNGTQISVAQDAVVVLPLQTASFRVQNAVAGPPNANYEVTGFFTV
jgi:hypothetical protein